MWNTQCDGLVLLVVFGVQEQKNNRSKERVLRETFDGVCSSPSLSLPSLCFLDRDHVRVAQNELLVSYVLLLLQEERLCLQVERQHQIQSNSQKEKDPSPSHKERNVPRTK